MVSVLSHDGLRNSNAQEILPGIKLRKSFNKAGLE